MARRSRAMERWQLGNAGATLSVEAHLMTGANRALAGVCGVICLLVSAAAMVTGDREPHALVAIFAVAGGAALVAALRRPQRVVVSEDALIVPSWIPGLSPRIVSLDTLKDVLHVPAPYSDALSQIFVRGDVRVAVLVPRSRVGELTERLRLRGYARRVDAPDAIALLETYFAPGPKPLGVIRKDDRWVAFHDIADVPGQQDASYRQSPKAITVVMETREFSLLERACPNVSFQHLPLSRFQ